METFVLAGGRTEVLVTAFRALRGVVAVERGHAGGAEAVAVTFDAEEVPAEIVLAAFFTMHDPCLLDGRDVDGYVDGYAAHRSAMFPVNDGQTVCFERARDRAMQWWDGLVVTTIEPRARFESAERSLPARVSPREQGSRGARSAVARVRARFPDFARG